MLRFISLFVFLFAQGFPLNSYAENLYEALDIKSNFTLRVSEPIPTEYVFTEGANEPEFEPHSVAIFTVADLDKDNCDDVILNWADSLSPIQVFYGSGDGFLKRKNPFQSEKKVRTVRQFKFADLNQDGFLDIVGFTAPHGWKKEELGILWDADEPEFVALSQGSRKYRILDNAYETYSHTGLLGDVDNDGTTDIIQITEVPARGGELNLIQNSAVTTSVSAPIKPEKYAIFDSRSGDINDDGLIDTVFTISKSYRKHLFVSPKDANELGTIAIFFGASHTPLNKIKPVILGGHWMVGKLWEEFLSTKSAEERREAYAGTSNVELMDMDHDGDTDILIGYFVQAKSHWMTSGVQILKNEAGTFLDATSELMPHQPANRSISRPTDLMYEANLVDLNNDGFGDLVLALRGLDSMTESIYSSVFYLFKNGKYVPVKNDETLLGDTPKMQLIQTGDFNCDGKGDLVGLFQGIPDRENHYLKTLIAR
jgi:hypothetical protein